MRNTRGRPVRAWEAWCRPRQAGCGCMATDQEASRWRCRPA